MDNTNPGTDRRSFLRLTGVGAVVLAAAPWLEGCVVPTPVDPPPTTTPTVGYGPLQPADANGLRLPVGFTSRVIATVGATVAGTGYVLPGWPDGGACFTTGSGGWTYVCNHELNAPDGGVSAISFAADGTITAAQRILVGTNRNCAGGPTPWGTWLSCEEWSRGLVHECDPTGATAALARPAMGAFQHEAVAFAPTTGAFYLTEDRSDGCLYRFTPTIAGDLASGVLEVLIDDAGTAGWAAVPDPSAATTSTRLQVGNARHFDGGEGITCVDDAVYFTTKGDNRVWVLDLTTSVVSVAYDAATSATPVLTGVDNVTATTTGELIVAEDGGDMQLVLLHGAAVEPVLQLDGVSGSELAGPAFSPDGTRLYVSSQRNPGTIYEVTGPWHNTGA